MIRRASFLPPLRSGQALALSCALCACSRADAPTASKSAARATAASAASTNPFARTYPVKSAKIVYEGKDGTRKEYQVRGRWQRSQTTRGPWISDMYTLVDGETEMNVDPTRRQVVRFRTAESHLFESYRVLDASAQARVRASIEIIGPDAPFYQENVFAAEGERDIHGLRARCYRLTSRIFEGRVTHACYWRGITLSYVGNTLDGTDVSGEATQVVIDGLVDDALFVAPTEYAREEASTEEIMHGVYNELLVRMQRPNFALDQLDRHAR